MGVREVNVGAVLNVGSDHFFFQAEDGIRDIGVTGVQTCALPIYQGQLNPQGNTINGQWHLITVKDKGTFELQLQAAIQPIGVNVVFAANNNNKPDGRSEERRVGKECRCRWSRYHYKKNSR